MSLHARQQQRLIAEARYYDTTSIGNPGALRLTDSAKLSYSNGRGSTVDPNRLDYFDLNRFQGSGALINFYDHVAPANNLDSGAAYPHVAFDTLRYYDANPYYGIRLDQTEVCTYYADNNLFEVSHINRINRTCSIGMSCNTQPGSLAEFILSTWIVAPIT